MNRPFRIFQRITAAALVVLVAGVAGGDVFAAGDAPAKKPSRRVLVRTSSGTGDNQKVQSSYTYDRDELAKMSMREQSDFHEDAAAGAKNSAAGAANSAGAAGVRVNAIAGESVTRAPAGIAAPVPPVPEAAPPVLRGERLDDGRVLPWRATNWRKNAPVTTGGASFFDRLAGGAGAGGKPVDESVDSSASLRDFGRVNERFAGRLFDKGDGWAGAGADRASPSERRGEWRETRWNFGSSVWNGGKSSPLALRERRDAEVLERNVLESERRDHRVSALSGRETSLGGGASRFARRDAALAAAGIRPLKVIGEFSQMREIISMQDINRYSFRRAHSSSSGQPVVSPAGAAGTVGAR